MVKPGISQQRSLTGWLTTKKKGRDDAEIAKDKRRAIAERKRQRQQPRKPSAKKAKRRDDFSEDEYESEISESDESMGDFVVEDDDEDSLLEVDEVDDESQASFPSAKRQQTSKRTSDATFLTAATAENTLESDSDSEGGTFFPSHKARNSIPSQALRKASLAAQNRRNPTLQRSKASVAQEQRKRLANTLTVPKIKTPKGGLVAKKQPLQVESDSDDSDVLVVGAPAVMSRDNKSKYFSGSGSKVTPFDTSEEDVSPVVKRRRRSLEAQDSLQFAAPAAATASAKTKTENPKTVFSDSESDDSFVGIKKQDTGILDLKDTPEPPRRIKKLKKKTIKANNPFAAFSHRDENESSMDEDEADALRLAIKASKKDMKRDTETKKNKASVVDVVEEDDNDDNRDDGLVDQILEESSEDENDDASDDYDQEQEAATSVLQTAEKLSSEVLATMKAWMSQQPAMERNDQDLETTNATHGMIVDGALSFGATSLTNDEMSANANKNWISQETMKKACSGVTLSGYQLIGVNWLALLDGMKCEIENKPTPVNGVLADEMGLGKTVQTIAFLAWLRYRRQQQETTKEPALPHLIVVPVSVLPNWLREFETFCPEMHVVKYHGSMAEREEIKEELRYHLPGKPQPANPIDVILAPITYFQKEKSDDRAFLNKFRFNYLVVDEAHMLKNSQSTRYRNLNRIKTMHRLLLTGTPVQNSPKELLNMLCFIMPLFAKGNESMEEESDKGDRMLQHFVDAKMEQNGDERVAYKKLKLLFAPFVLRRKKVDVIAQLLPPKERIVEYVQLDANGRDVYDSILKAHVEKNGNKVTAAIGDHLFTNLRKAAHHPLLLRNRYRSDAEIELLTTYFHKYGAFRGEGSTKQRVAEEVSKYNDFNIHLTALELIEENRHRKPDLQRYVLKEEDLFSSAKFARLRVLLPSLIGKGHRVLIFSGWTSCLDLLGCLMENLGLEYLRMDGNSGSDERQGMIDEFNNNASIKVFLLSTRACGLGINLTAADTCIIHDLDFNPFNDLQAEDRCHRIGQKKKVTVYKLVAEDTVDADIYDMQDRKSKMNAAIMESKEEKKERKMMVQSAVARFASPKPK